MGNMKLAFASFITLAAADKASIDRQLMAQVQNSSLRAFSGNIANAVERLDEYGCWCYFYDNLFAFLISGTPIAYDTYGHNDSDFDPATDAGCPVKAGIKGVSGEKSCCGGYPNRFPFKTLDGDRACCGSRTYNTQLLNCCANGQVKANC